jgi:hypothetical protein
LRIPGLVLVAALLLYTALFGAHPAAAAEGRVVMVVIDRMSLSDLGASEAFGDLVPYAGLGLMNTNTGGLRNVENSHASIGAGSRIVATGVGFPAFEVNERVQRIPAGEEYARRTGVAAPDGSVVHLGIARVWELTRALPYPAEVGALGTALRANGLVTGVLGNADWDGMPRRPAALIAMDGWGLVDRGVIGDETLAADSRFPGGLRTDYERLFAAFRDADGVDFLVIELGDLSRLDEARPMVLPEVLTELRASALKECAEFVERVRRELDSGRDLLLVVSPTPPAASIAAGDTLSPVLMFGPEGSGTLTAFSTRRPGIVNNTDLAPTVTRFLHVDAPVNMTGRPLTVIPGKPDLGGLQALNRQLVLTHNVRAPIIKTYMTIQVAVVIAALLTILFREIGIVRREYIRGALLVIMSFPLAALVLPLLPQPGPVWVGVQMVAVTLAVGAAAIRMSRHTAVGAFAFLGGLTALVILVDLFLDAPLQKFSLLSYDPLGGARYYGIGNEFMGVLIGAVILTAVCTLTLAPRRFRGPVLGGSGALFLITLFAMANPGIGANMGGTITALVAFPVTILLLLNVRFTRRLILAGAGGVFVFLAGLTAFEFMRGAEQQSHIGRAARLVFGGDLERGFQEAYSIIERKVSMNLKLIRYTIWSRVYLASLGGLILLFYRPTGRMQTFRDQYPYVFKGLVGIAVASVVALIFNDSGVVASAMVMMFGAPPLLYLFLEED